MKMSQDDQLLTGLASPGSMPVTVPALMVHLELGVPNTGLLQTVDQLARSFHSKIIGIAAKQPIQIIYNDGCYVAPEVIQEDRDEINKDIAAAKAEFTSALVSHSGRLEWRSSFAFQPVADYLAHEARSADLFVTTRPSSGKRDATRLDTGELLMLIGRPVLLVPPQHSGFGVKKAVLGWKDTRECRRAALDAIPLLKMATHVRVIEMTEEADLPDARARLADVATWLLSHGINADTLASPADVPDAPGLSALAHEYGANLIVAGAYGHSRVREWALGGMTRSLLLQSECMTLLSH